ncbi:SoxR reducing system RseC family protein [Bacteroides sp. 51]|uniref:SoxR reducing system RseC family protein n=1 Tax=Bacteroides sp. 51 TaxID=2302938 RepID=UPI0013CFDB90|nr:SoxR reducing system RseC family protein [Bacteroides sp. 51]NDV82907.1 RseC/MucC family positive regulator of sigma(E) [Bacteroides sp. 51]
MANVITHQGIVENIDDAHVFVRIIQTSACVACSVKGHCSSADSKEKILEISAPYSSYKPGDQVTVVGETSMGMMAVLLAFFIPFLVLVISLFIFMHVSGGNELLSGLISLGLLVPYYFVVWLNRAKLKKNFSFTIKPINS